MTLATLLTGLLEGLVQATFVVAVVLVHRASGVVLLAVPVLGLAGASLAFGLAAFTPLGFGVGLLGGLALGAAIGAACGLLVQRFRPYGWILASIATLALTGPLVLVAANIDGLPFFPPANERVAAQLDRLAEPARLLPWPDATVEVGSLGISFGVRHVVAAQVVLSLLAAVALLLRGRWGTRLATAAAGPRVAATSGVHAPAVAVAAWAVAGVLAAGAAVSHGLATSAEVLAPPPSAAWLLALVLVGWSRPVVAAAVAAGLPLLGKAWEAQGWHEAWLAVVLVVVAVLLMVVLGRGGTSGGPSTEGHDRTGGHSRTPGSDAWKRLRLPAPGRPRPGLVAAAVAAGVALVAVVPLEQVFRIATVLAAAPLVAAIVVAVGWAGVPTLAAVAWAATGMVVLELLHTTVLGFWGAAAVAVVGSAIVAVLLDAAQLRRPSSRGLLLSLAASGTAAAVLVRLQPGFAPVPRPSLSVVDLADERVHGIVVLLLVAAVGLGLATLARRPAGRVLTLVRDDPATAQVLGRSPVRVRALALAVAGGLAGLFGVLTTMGTGAVDTTLTGDVAGIAALAAAIGGLTSASAIATGPLWVLGVPLFLDTDLVQELLRLGGSPALLYLAPMGLGEVGRRTFASVRRIASAVRGRTGDATEVADLATAPAIATGAWVPDTSVHARPRQEVGA